ncbi:hypothetical protein I656_03474 [Geobacillus sp. WSUCF1]|nr:hypothetical protein I656_03474 [Geobacillus sp. WSUCF1]
MLQGADLEDRYVYFLRREAAVTYPFSALLDATAAFGRTDR